jgi:LuxR family maltose regulon positive regulatory protein
LDARRRWYRYHHLFADVLRTHLRTTRDEVSVADLHRRASHWYAQNDDVVAATSHALAADDHAGAAALMEVAIPDLLRERRESTVVSWIDAVPNDVVQARPVLAMGFVAALMSRNDFDRVPPRLRDLEPFLSAAPSGAADAPPRPAAVVTEDPSQLGRLPGRAELYRAGLALVAGDLEGTHHHVSRVAKVCAPGDLATQAGAFGLSGLAHWSVGDLEDAHQCYTSCVDVLLQAGHVSDVLGCSITLADLRTTQGRLRDARATYEKALALAASGHDVVRGTPDMHTGLSALHLERNDIAAAEGHLRRAQELGEKSGLPQHPYRLRVAMAQLRHVHGDDEEALALLEEAERVYLADFSPNVRPVHATRARVLIALGRLGQAHAWAAEHHLTSLDQLTYVREYEHVTLALLLLAEHQASRSAGSTADALQLLGRLQRDAEAGGRAGTLIEVLVLTSLASWAHGNQDDAVSQLERAVALGEPEGYVRVFAQHATKLLPVLSLLPAPVADSTYVQALRCAARTAAADAPATSKSSGIARQALVDPLSRRELEVLSLLATDLTGPELARHLVVSLNTLRTHTRNVYAKLGVSGRRAAVSRARELDLLGRRGGRDRLTSPP